MMHVDVTQTQFVSADEVAESVSIVAACPEVVAHLCPGVKRDRAANRFDGKKLHSGTARLYRLRDVVLDTAHMVLLHQGRIISETNYLQSEAGLASLRVNTADLIRIEDDVPVVTCFDHWHTNYYHWTAHTIPALFAILAHYPEGGVRLALPVLKPWQRESLRVFGLIDTPTITLQPARQYALAHAGYCDIVAGQQDYMVSPVSRMAYKKVSDAVAAMMPQVARRPHLARPIAASLKVLKTSLFSRAASATAGRPGRKVYIDRTGSMGRRLGNEDEFITRLRARGFTIARLETMKFAQQVALFMEASFVVGLHGAGLSNIVYCRPNTLIYEIFPKHYLNPCIMVMALQGQLTYWMDVFESGVVDGDFTTPWACNLDIERAMQRIAELEGL